MSVKVLIVEDQEAFRASLRSELTRAGFEVVEARDGREGLRAFELCRPDVVVTDHDIPVRGGIELVADIRRASRTPVIVITTAPTIESAVHAMKVGATDYLVATDLDFDSLEDLIREATAGPDGGSKETILRGAFPGASPAALSVRRRIQSFAPISSAVTIGGPRGSDRLAVARALHGLGPSAGGRLLALDAAGFDPRSSVPPSACLFIDHLDAASEDLLEHLERWYADLGESPRIGREIPRLLVGAGRPFALRERMPRLHALLSRFVIELPALDDHLEDVPACARVQLERIARDLCRPGLTLGREACDLLTDLRWPLNEAELRDVLERAVIASEGRSIGRSAVEAALAERGAGIEQIRRRRASNERSALLEALERAGGNVTRASRLMGTSRSAVYRMMDRHGVPRARRP